MIKLKKIQRLHSFFLAVTILLILSIALTLSFYHECSCCNSIETNKNINADCCVNTQMPRSVYSFEKKCTCMEQEPLGNLATIKNRASTSHKEIQISVSPDCFNTVKLNDFGKDNFSPEKLKFTGKLYNNEIFTLISSFLI